LENTNIYLEERVKQRTQELNQKNLYLTQEIQQRETAENQLASEKELLAVTLRSIGDGVITTNLDGSVVLMNKISEELTGWSQEEAVGRPLKEVFHIINEQTRELCDSPVERVIETGRIVGLANHTALIRKDSREFIIADSAAPIRDKNSVIVGVVLVFRDITDLQRREKELIKIRKLESVGVLAGGIAHDFNNILSAILGNINLALFDTDLKNETKSLLTEAEKASLRARDLTQQLLTFAKGGDPVKEASSLEVVIKDSANFVLHGDKVVCQFDIPENLWLVDIDKGQISQVIQNIVLNASHAMPEGGVVKVSCENISTVEGKYFPLLSKRQYVRICIEDCGVGIPANIIEKIFDPYFSTKHEGSGLGLAICQSVINKHGGHITVDSSSGIGTTFSIYLPASTELEEAQEHIIEVSNRIKQSSSLRILVMDDEEMVRTIAKKMLVELGHEVVLSENGKEAIKLYQDATQEEKKFDLVIMDLTIPGGMGGKGAVQEILTTDSNAKVIVSSGYSNDPVMANFKNYGFCSSIVKPYQLQELSKVISQAFE
jgi:PAS domain S-box-containing protein